MFECRHQPLTVPPALAAELAAAYGEPHREYHNGTHITELLGWFDKVSEEVGWQQPAEVYVTILFHDAIYVPGAKDNEARSAEWAKRSGLPVDLERVAQLILLTAQHGHHAAADHDTALFLDGDMAILAATPDAYRDYAKAIASEYAVVPPDAYRAGRRAFVLGLAHKPRIFLSDYFHTRCDAQARANLRAEAAELGG